MDSRLMQAAAITGVGIGILSGLPCISVLNCLFCGWVWLGGIFGVWWYNRSALGSATTGQGVTLGAVAGLIGAVVATLLSALFGAAAGAGASTAAQLEQLAQQSPEMAEAVRQLGPVLTGGGSLIVSLITSLVLFAIFGAIGGAIGAAIFGRRTATPAM